ncbi:MAG TPA: nicotinate phosphoribosyltransferase [Phaeodactylibacter sp.]|nr:nicotinate phosphoribosyltransferase [Phaeodactylibacter sp.]
MLQQLYRPDLGLLTDLYELTMSHAYRENGMEQDEAIFYLYFRKLPAGWNYAIAAGTDLVAEYLENWRFSAEDVAYLGSLKTAEGHPLFTESFLNYLQRLRFTGRVDVLPEGELVFPNQPILRIQAPLIEAQIIESALLNLVNFSTLIATKAARIVQAAGDGSVLEFGLRRAQGIDGSITASRSAYIGGCSGTSNVLAGRLLGIPVKGTHAHSWVMSFDTEPEAFERYAKAMPENALFLVDTYDSIQGIKHAIAVGKKLRQKGYRMLGIRLDSGDLAKLSKTARKMLDEAGFPEAVIVASNQLDEDLIARLRKEKAPIAVWGVGTQLVTGQPAAAIGGVYKMAAIRKKGEDWQARIKLSENPEKISHPGQLQIRRFYENDIPIGDLLYDQLHGPSQTQAFGQKWDEGRDLLQPLLINGKRVQPPKKLSDIRAFSMRERQRFLQKWNGKTYPAKEEKGFAERKNKLIQRLSVQQNHAGKNGVQTKTNESAIMTN